MKNRIERIFTATPRARRKNDKHERKQGFVWGTLIRSNLLLTALSLLFLPLTPMAANANEESRPWFDAGIEFPLTPVGRAADFSNCGNWLVYSNSRPGAPSAQSIRLNVIDSSSENAAEWTRVATLTLESELGFTNSAQARDIAYHPQHDAFAVTHAATNNEDGIAFFDASDPNPENWQQVQFGDITLGPHPEGTSLRFTDDGAFLAVGVAINTLDEEFNLGWDVFDTSDPDPANWDFANVRPGVISGDDALGGTARDAAFSPDGNLLVFVHHTEQEDNSDQHITVINSSGDEWFGLFNQPNVSGRAWGVDFHPGGEWFLVTYSGGISLFDASTMEEVSGFNIDLGESGSSARFSSDGNILAVSFFNEVGDEGIRWIDSSSPNPADWAIDNSIGPTDLPSSALSITFSSDDEYVAMAHREEPYATVAQRLQPPSGPRDVSASYVEGSFDGFLNEGDIAVSWQHPEFDGGAGIDRYELRSADGAFGDLVLDSNQTSVVVTFDYTQLADTGLVPLELLAVGQANLESPAAEAAAVLPTVPGPVSDLEPVGLNVDGIVANWQFAWLPPENDGGTALTGYRVRTEFASGGQNLFEVQNEFIEVEFGLDGGQISVAAENDFGESGRVGTGVPTVTEPALADDPAFVAVRAAGDSHFDVDVQVSPVANWGFVGNVEAPPGDYVFSYEAVGGPIEVTRAGGSGAAEILATLTIPAEALNAGEGITVQARNEYGAASSPRSTNIPVFIDSINPPGDLSASQPIWDNNAETYLTDISWAAYHPFSGGASALSLLEGGDVPIGTVTVVVTNSPPATAPTTGNITDLPLDKASAPDFGDATAQVSISGLVADELVSDEVTASIPAPLPATPGPVSNLEPTGLEVSGTEAAWQFEWQAPEDEGGAPLTGYRVRTELASGGENLFEVDEPFIEVEFGLDGGQISVAAENEFGESELVSTGVPTVTEPVLADDPAFVAVREAGDSHFDVDVQVSTVANWGFVGYVEAPPGDYVFSYEAAGGPIEVTREGGSGAAEILATLTIPAEALNAGEGISVKARNEHGASSSPRSTNIPVFVDSINPLSNLSTSQPTWDEVAGAYVTNISWADYQPFSEGESALALLEGGDVPVGTVTVDVANSPPTTAPTTGNITDLALGNASAPDFGDATAQVSISGLVADELVSDEASASIPAVGAPQTPVAIVTNPRFTGSVLLHDLALENPGEHSAPIVEAQAVSADDGVTVSVDAQANGDLSGTLAVDLAIAEYQDPNIGSTYPAALVALIDAAGVVGDSAVAEALSVPDPEPVTITDLSVSFDAGNATLSIEIEISDLEAAGPSEDFTVTVSGEPVAIQSVEGDEENVTVSVNVPSSELITDTEVSIARISVTGANSVPTETQIEGLGDGVFFDAFEGP